MSATTIKIEDPLLKELLPFVHEKGSLTAFVRESLEREVRRRRMAEAAETYVAFLASNPGEREWLEKWESVDLANAPRVGRRRKGR